MRLTVWQIYVGYYRKFYTQLYQSLMPHYFFEISQAASSHNAGNIGIKCLRLQYIYEYMHVSQWKSRKVSWKNNFTPIYSQVLNI